MKIKELTDFFIGDEAALKQGSSSANKPGRLSVRERLDKLIDPETTPFEMGLWAAYEMYQEWGGAKAAGVVTLIAQVAGRNCMIIANDASVKAGAFFPQSVKKVIRAQRVAYECRLPILYLVDSSGVFLPLQDEIFPDEDDFGRIFRNNAVLSAAGIPQFAAIMGNCIAGGGYLPVLCDQLLMTEGSGLYLAGPALVKAAIGQIVDPEELGGAKMHAELSGTVDYLAKDDADCLGQLRKLVGMLPEDPELDLKASSTESDPHAVYEFMKEEGYDAHLLLKTLVDEGSWIEYKSEYGKTILTGFAKMGGLPVGIVINQRIPVTTGRGEIEIGGVLYADSADKTARFVMECNQMHTPLLFFQDVIGFMVGKDAEASGIIRSGAKLVNAISNSVVPKITCIIGNSFGAGHYALCGKAYDPNFIIAWPTAKYAVMGAKQAKETLDAIQKKGGEAIYQAYMTKTNIRYGAARGWVDALIAPHTTRAILLQLLTYVKRAPERLSTFHTGVIQT